MNWLFQHTDFINTLANIGVLLVWLVYAQLLYRNYSRQRQAKIIINQVQGYDLDSMCMISNMSQEAIYLECLIAEIVHEEGTLLFNIADHKRDPEKQSRDKLSTITLQGPLQSSGHVIVGKFRDILNRTLGESLTDHNLKENGEFERVLAGVRSLEIRAIADYGPEDNPICARKRFILEKADPGKELLYPENFSTEQAYNFRSRRMVRKQWLETCKKR